MPSTGNTHTKQASTSSTLQTTSSTTPAASMSRNAIRPVANTTALGGVAIGSAKPNEAAIVAGSISTRGSSSALRAVASSTGIISDAIATLVATSLSSATATTTSPSARTGDMLRTAG